MKSFDIFLSFAQNIDRGTHNLCFEAKIRKMYTFYYIKGGCKGVKKHGHVIMMNFAVQRYGSFNFNIRAFKSGDNS